MAYDTKSQSTSAHRIPNALRHGFYSTTAVLPGEDQAAFDKLHRELIAEYSPHGASEIETVATIARATWRKKNPKTLRIAELAQNRLSSVLDEMIAEKFSEQARPKIHPESKKMVGAAEDLVRAEFGVYYGLVEMGPAASFEGLTHDLDLEERLDGIIERGLKRLLFIRGLKSMSGANTSAPVKHIAGPPKVA